MRIHSTLRGRSDGRIADVDHPGGGDARVRRQDPPLRSDRRRSATASSAEEAAPEPVAGESAVVSFDRVGVPDIDAATFLDAMHALGRVHAEERYLQMDGARRQAAGELSAVFGASTVGMDRASRVLGLRAHANEIVERLPSFQRRALDAYVDGVNAALADDAPPIGDAAFYSLLRVTPEPWDARRFDPRDPRHVQRAAVERRGRNVERTDVRRAARRHRRVPAGPGRSIRRAAARTR